MELRNKGPLLLPGFSSPASNKIPRNTHTHTLRPYHCLLPTTPRYPYLLLSLSTTSAQLMWKHYGCCWVPFKSSSQILLNYFSKLCFLNWRIKNQLDATFYFIVLLIGPTCFGHYYAHHQELATIMLITTLVVSFLVCCLLEVRSG
jgi:hypothetical protein